jgi:hypothetical protein
MQSNVVAQDDVIASFEKYGNIFGYSLKKVRDLKTLNPQAKFDCTYIPLVFKYTNGKEVEKFRIKFSEQIIASSAKIPQGGDDKEGGVSHVSISFTDMSYDDIKGGDYTPKTFDDEKKQKAENKRSDDNIKRYVDNNKKFLKVLDIVDVSYKKTCDDLQAETTLPFKLKKDRNQKTVTVFSIKQSTRADPDNADNDLELEYPIYRCKLPVYRKDGRIGIWSTYNNVFKYTVFDARKMNKKNNYASVPAKVKENGRLVELTAQNANQFITYKSLIGGSLSVECIVSSKFGLSLSNGFYETYVFKHKSKSAASGLSKEEVMLMRGGAESGDETDTDTDDEPLWRIKSKKEKASKSAAPVDSDDDKAPDVVTPAEKAPDVVTPAEKAPVVVDDDDDCKKAPTVSDDDDDDDDDDDIDDDENGENDELLAKTKKSSKPEPKKAVAPRKPRTKK